MRPAPSPRTRIPELLCIAAAAAFLGWLLSPADAPGGRVSAGAGPQPLTLDDVFAADGVLADILDPDRAWNFTGPAPRVTSRFVYFDQSVSGPVFFGYCKPGLADPCECDCDEGIDPCVEPGHPPILKRARQTIQLWLPSNPNFAQAPYLYVDKVTGREGPLVEEKVLLARILAKKGIPAALWSEDDMYPVGAEPIPEIHEQFGYNGQASFQQAALRWMRTRDPMNLTVEAFRFDDRYHNAQSYVLTTTFFQRVALEFFGSDPEVESWAHGVQAFYAGGSKTGGGAVTASGVDPRCVGNRISNFSSYDGGDRSAPARYDTDWRECPQNCPRDDACTPVPDEEHKWLRQASWSFQNRFHSPSYFDIYRPDFDRARYADLLMVEIGGTHDWIGPLGSHHDFWRSVDGLVDGVPDASEDRWNFRLVRRINHDHGVPKIVGQTGGGRDVRADQLLVWGSLRHLAKNKPLPRIEMVSIDASGDPAADPWTARVRMTNLRPGHDPATDEQFTVWVALSDDRDFRRCTPPIVCRNIDQTPCEQNGICRDPAWDDNQPNEDFFIRIDDPIVSPDGEFRNLTFGAPPEALAVPNPIVAVIVDTHLEGGVIGKIQDDWVLSTDAAFFNEEAYAPHQCCP